MDKPDLIGIEPRYIWLEKRRDELYAAIERYRSQSVSPHIEWLEELILLEREIQSLSAGSCHDHATV